MKKLITGLFVGLCSLNIFAAEVTITVGDAIAYDVHEIKAAAGEQVTVTINHTGSLPKTAMGHNVVFLTMGTDANAFAKEAIAAAGTGYIPEGDERIIASTELVGGGESSTVEFTAPSEPGEYTYICTFPGHSGAMRGTLIVE